MLADGARAPVRGRRPGCQPRHFERAYQLAERAGDVQAMALAALGLAGLWVSERRTVTGAVLLEARLEHVLSLLDPGSSLALRVRTRLAGEADYLHGAHAAILAALAAARAAGDPGAAGRGAEHGASLPARSRPRPASAGNWPSS